MRAKHVVARVGWLASIASASACQDGTAGSSAPATSDPTTPVADAAGAERRDGGARGDGDASVVPGAYVHFDVNHVLSAGQSNATAIFDGRPWEPLAAAPTGANRRLRYAYTLAGCRGPRTLARGNLRDSDRTPSVNGYDLFNRAVHFDVPIP
jgi:hypothetical protein